MNYNYRDNDTNARQGMLISQGGVVRYSSQEQATTQPMDSAQRKRFLAQLLNEEEQGWD
jgi:hypothetical protein